MTLHDEPRSLWSATTPEAADDPILHEHLECDVAIVGAGFTGLRAALRLAEAGRSVVVLDRHAVGWGASGRNGGQVNPLPPFNSPAALRGNLGEHHFKPFVNASLGSADALFAFIAERGIDCGARQNGWLRVDHSTGAAIASRANTEAWNALGADMRRLDRDQILELTGTKAYSSGVLTTAGGAVNPLALVRGIAALVRNAGGKIFSGSGVAALQEEAGRWALKTSGGEVRAQQVVLATNGYSDGVRPDVRRSILPLVSVQIATDTLAEGVTSAVLPRGHTISDTRRVIMYARREPAGQMVFGGHGVLRRDGTLAGFKWLERDAVRVFPQLEGVNWRYRWGGRIALTDDHVPHLHEPAPGLLAGLGYNGRGVAMSNLMGTVLADRVLGADAATLPLPITTVRAYPLRTMAGVAMGPLVGFMKWQDAREVAAATRELAR
ncbi:FAD-binding oxidoreductase [Rhizobiaceae bacterium]|nr:FAD-binding oxidoreductase [Rhizobiaceae bacterium]